MPRYRKLHAKTVESFDFNEMPDDFTRLFWVLLPLGLSREGTLPATPALVRSKIFPLREDITFDMIRVALNWFAERDMIRFYEAEGHQYLWAVNFAHYQGNTVKESDSNYPPPPEQWSNDTESTPDLLLTNSGPTPDQLPTNSSTDSVCTMQIQYSDADSDADSEADAIPTVTTAAAAISESPESLASHVYTTIAEGMGWKLAPNALEEIGALIDDYPEREWWDYALRECAISQTRNLRYLDKCLATAQENAQPVKPVEIREKRAGPPAEWNRVLETMYSTQTRKSVDMWLGSATVEVIDKTLIIGPSTRNARDWIENRMAASITDAVGQALGDDWGWKLEEADDGTG